MSDTSAESAPQRRSTLRLLGTVTFGVAVAVLLAVVVAAFMLRFNANAQTASLALRSARPWMVGAQIVALGLLWNYWPAVVTFISRWRPMDAHVQAELVQGRTRIFGLLIVIESLVVLRALAG